MTPATTTDQRKDAHHPVQVALDGDFALDDLRALPSTGRATRICAAQATQAALWRLDATGHAEPPAPLDSPTPPTTPTVADTALLRHLETSGLFQPPVSEQVAALTPRLAASWLALAAHWADLADVSGDLRFLNTACKLTGAVWLRHIHADGAWHSTELTGQLGAVGRLLASATSELRQRLDTRLLLAEPAAGPHDLALAPLRPSSRTSRARIIVLAASGSRSAGRLVAAATVAALPIDAVCWYTSRTAAPPPASNYSAAWYPPGPPTPDTAVDLPASVPATTAGSWDGVAAAIRAAHADLVLLVGMPVVPASVLDAARLGTLNAHNGALPSHRGMDAVGWALINNQPVVCSLHLARAAVDTGELLAARPVPASPTRTLAARVKSTQLRLLLAGATYVATTGSLPDSTPQPAGGTQYYRLHPHLKRLLDASPYANDDHPQWMASLP